MTIPADPVERYRAQIVECAQAMTVARNDGVAGYLSGPYGLSSVKMFTDGNLDKRFTKLEAYLDELADVFDDMEELIVAYIKQVPLAAYSTESSDADRFLDWLANKRKLTAEQADYVTLIRSRYAVELSAEENRIGHVRFQELRSTVSDFSPQVATNPRLWIHRNPIRVWGEFQSRALVEEGDSAPCTVIFFAFGNEVRTAILEPPGIAVVRALETAGPCKLDDLTDACTSLEQYEIVDVCRDLAETGLAAFG